ncbi:MAG: type II secretion system F family protein, partial [Betaproteobacteria bacterium]
MPFFSYKGRDAGGAAVQGVLEGTDSSAVAGRLFGMGIVPLDIRPAAVPSRRMAWLALPFVGGKVTHTEVLLFSRQMYTLLRAGVP